MDNTAHAEVGRIFGWKTFRIGSIRFLCYDKGGSWGVVNEYCENYGGYHSIDSFRQMYARRGEDLNLTKAQAPPV